MVHPAGRGVPLPQPEGLHHARSHTAAYRLAFERHPSLHVWHLRTHPELARTSRRVLASGGEPLVPHRGGTAGHVPPGATAAPASAGTPGGLAAERDRRARHGSLAVRALGPPV